MVSLCKPLLQQRRFGTITELTSAMKEKHAAWFVSDKMSHEAFVRKIKWIFDRLGEKAWNFLRENIRSKEGKGHFSDNVVCNVKTLLPADSKSESDPWRSLDEDSQLMLYDRLHRLNRPIGKKDVEQIHRSCIVFHAIRETLQKVSKIRLQLDNVTIMVITLQIGFYASLSRILMIYNCFCVRNCLGILMTLRPVSGMVNWILNLILFSPTKK